MKNKEIEELLNKLEYASECDDFIIEIRKDRAKLLLSYIEQLEQLENNKDKAIEICDFYNKKYQKDPLGNQKVLFVISNIMNVLKGDSDEV